jgi:hypothetical protein
MPLGSKRVDETPPMPRPVRTAPAAPVAAPVAAAPATRAAAAAAFASASATPAQIAARSVIHSLTSLLSPAFV